MQYLTRVLQTKSDTNMDSKLWERNHYDRKNEDFEDRHYVAMTFEEQMSFAMTASLEEIPTENVLLDKKWNEIEVIQKTITDSNQLLNSKDGRIQLSLRRKESRNKTGVYRRQSLHYESELNTLVPGEIYFCVRLVMSFLDGTDAYQKNGHQASLGPTHCRKCRISGACGSLTFCIVRIFCPDLIEHADEIMEKITIANRKMGNELIYSMNQRELTNMLNSELEVYRQIYQLTLTE